MENQKELGMNPPERAHPHRAPTPIASRWWTPLVAAALLHITTITADREPTSASPSVWKSGTHRLTVDGRDRMCILDVPSKLKGGAPLVMVFHGFTGSAKEIRQLTGFAKMSEQYGFVAVYPQGTRDSKGKSFFNVGYEFHRDQSVDDVQFVRGLAERLTHDLHLDSRAVFDTGFSNGGEPDFWRSSSQKSSPF